MRLPPLPVVATLLVAVSAVTAASAAAQCRPGPRSNEAKLLAFYSVPIAFTPDPGTFAMPDWSWRLSLEGAVVPTPGAGIRHTGACFQSKTESTNLAPVFGRPRVAFSLAHGIGVEASYLPPVTVFSATPQLASIAAWAVHNVSSTLLAGVRAQLTGGTVRGPITCARRVLQQQNPSAPCYGTTPSRDTFRPNMSGVDVLVGTRPRPGRRWSLEGGAGFTALNPRFHVHFTDSNGFTDTTRIVVNLTRVAAFAGGDLQLGRRCDAALQVDGTVGDVATARGFVGCRW